jgi:anti-sigma regulatory factor (Ser/Thr protein kinase)
MEVTSRETSVLVPVRDGSQVGEARRAAVRFGAALGFGEADAGRLAIVATEAAGNLARHGGGGDLLLRRIAGAEPALELLALDRGPGMADVARALEDGHSTGGTPGTGLGAIQRLSTACELYSSPGTGTALMARLSPFRASAPRAAMEVGAVSLPAAGEAVCGDGWAVSLSPGRSVAMVVDGLGHGAPAAAAAAEAVGVFARVNAKRPGEILDALHGALRPTRGAAVSVAQIDLQRRQLTFAGIGNVGGTVLGRDAVKNMVSFGGIVGHEYRRAREFEYAWPAGAVLVMHSDGLQSQWKLEAYPGLSERHPALIAGILYRDYTRGRDDVTVLAIREPR